MSEDKSKSYTLRGNDPIVGAWCRNKEGNYFFGATFSEVALNLSRNIRDEEKEKHMIERFKQ